MVLASAGAGKSELIARAALTRAARGETVLILTYTVNNQAELVTTICRLNRHQPRNIIIKGWFTFLLEDMIRPYQRCVLDKRVRSICFDESDPHLKKRGKWTFRTQSEKNRGEDTYNARYFMTSEAKAHTTYLSKLAARISEESEGKPAQRLARIYRAVYIDEVQDLTGWDFDIIEAISNGGIEEFDCVGDFRQTIYRTSTVSKAPRTNDEKLEAFKGIGFKPEFMNISRRCVQSICDLAHLVHGNGGDFPATESQVKEVPANVANHVGIFAVSSAEVRDYLERYRPVILRWSKIAEKALCNGREAYTFGEAKGLGFDRVLLVPTKNYVNFLSGQHDTFDKDATDLSRNKLYVGITRARYSVAFLHAGESVVAGAEVWKTEGSV